MSSESPNGPPARAGEGPDAAGPSPSTGATTVMPVHESAEPRGTGASPGETAAMPAAKTPRSTGGIAVLGILMAGVLTAVGVLAVRDALVYGGLLGGSPVLHGVANWLQGLQAAGWMVVVGVVLALLGLALLVKALRPSAPKVARVTAATGVFLRPRDVTRLVETAVENVDGVLGVHASATSRRVTVTVRSTGHEGVEQRVRDAVTGRLAPLQSQPTIRVRTEGSSR